jgi:hypothetical protein
MLEFVTDVTAEPVGVESLSVASRSASVSFSFDDAAAPGEEHPPAKNAQMHAARKQSIKSIPPREG